MIGIDKLSVLVCGGRDFTDRGAVYRALDLLAGPSDADHMLGHTYLHIINGDARGTDRISTDWAIVNWSTYTVISADWEKYGKRAGPIRNAELLALNPDTVLAFPGGNGTADMVKKTQKAAYIEVPFKLVPTRLFISPLLRLHLNNS